MFIAAYAVFTSKCDASIKDTLAHGTNSGGVTSVHVVPPSRVT